MSEKISRRAQGDKGERVAKKFLLEKKWEFLAENFCVKGGEIDLIFKDDDEIVFVEVKTRKNNIFGTAQASITPAKIKHLTYAAKKYYLQNNKDWYTDPMRFDVVAVNISLENSPKIQHFKYALSFDDF